MKRTSRTRPEVILGALAAGLAAASGIVILGLASGAGLAAGAALHLGAAQTALLAARRRRPDLTQVESDLVLVTGLLLPILGPALAWCMPLPQGAEEPENAHGVFERYAKYVKPHVPDYERTLFTGNYDRDLARELDVESYHEVLRHGSTDQKRNALRRLAELGEPRHFELIRRCLLDPEHEVRLYAYSELERAAHVYEEEIGERARSLARRPGDGEALLVMARTYFAYAESGIHDAGMAAFYYGSAERYAGQARTARVEGPAPVVLQAVALGRMGEPGRAETLLAALPEAEQASPDACLARADLAFRRRDFAAARAEGRRMRAADAEPPPWLRALEEDA